MALSFCSSVINPATEFFISDSLVLDHQLAADYDFDYENHLLFSDNNFANLIPYHSSDNLVPLDHVASSYHYIKRRKSFEDCYASYGANVSVPCLFDVLSSIPAAPEFQIPAAGGEEGLKRSVSAQSMAARQRRRKITERTQELGKLVPGGAKMNTAEMFHAASKYVKWLQAQVAILKSMASIQEALEKTAELEVLLGSSVIEEKLYSEEKCLVPKKFVENMSKDSEIKSKPWIIKDINRLLKVQTKD